MNRKTRPMPDPVVCYDRFNPLLNGFGLSTYVMPGPVEDLVVGRCLTDSVFAPPKAGPAAPEKAYVVCYETDPPSLVRRPWVVYREDGESVKGLVDSFIMRDRYLGHHLTDSVWYVPGTLDFDEL